MAGYRRFIAYVYEYRKGKKENNCGFIKVQVRDRRCRLEVHLQCPGLSPQMECRIYGFVRNGGLMDGNLLDTCITDEGVVECLIETDALNMSNTGIGISKMGGLILKTDSGAFFGTEWDDIPIRPENFREVRVNTKPAPERTENRTEKSEPESRKENPAADRKSSEENRMDSGDERSHMREENGESLKDNADIRYEKNESMGLQNSERSTGTDMEKNKREERTDDAQINMQPEKKAETATEMNIQETKKMSITEMNIQQPEKKIMETGNSLQKMERNTIGIDAEMWKDESGISASKKDARQDEPRQNKNNPHPEEDGRLFEDGEFMECRRIQLKDLSHLNRRDAAMRNNRFLQYGYYNFGHLLICRRQDGRYILGVPGGYDQQERFMANMFGFPYFKESRHIQLPKGRGGYWYRLINTPDFH